MNTDKANDRAVRAATTGRAHLDAAAAVEPSFTFGASPAGGGGELDHRAAER